MGENISIINNVFIQCTTNTGRKMVAALDSPRDVEVSRSRDYFEMADQIRVDAKCSGLRILTVEEALEILDISEEELIGLINAE